MEARVLQEDTDGAVAMQPNPCVDPGVHCVIHQIHRGMNSEMSLAGHGAQAWVIQHPLVIFELP